MSEIAKHAEAMQAMVVISEFLDWCAEQRIELARMGQFERLHPLTEGQLAMLQRYFDIDAVKLENERRALIENSRIDSGKATP